MKQYRHPSRASQHRPVQLRSWQLYGLVALLVGGIALAGWLVGRPAQAPEIGIAQTIQSGDLAITLRVDQAMQGERTLDITISDSAGAPAGIDAVRLRFAEVELNLQSYEVTAQPLSTGHFQARGAFFTSAGRWRIAAIPVRAGQNLPPAAFDLAIAPPGGISGPLNPLKKDARTILAGQQLFRIHCVTCHGMSGRGDGPAAASLNPPPRDLIPQMIPGKYTEGQVYFWLKDGVAGSRMPAYGANLTEEQLWQLVTYLRTFKQPGQIVAAQPLDQTAQPVSPTQATALPTTATSPAVQTIAPAQTPAPLAPATPDPLIQLPPLVPDVAEPLPPLVFARQGAIWRSDGSAAPPYQVTHLSPEQYAEQPTVAPDGTQIAFIAMTQPPITSTVPLTLWGLYVMQADGSNLRKVWEPAKAQLLMPAWAPDGQSLYVMYDDMRTIAEKQGDEWQLRIVRVDLATGAQHPVVENGVDPTVAPDGSQLAYVRFNEQEISMSLEIADLDGSNPRTLIDSSSFQGFYAPRFSPDGKQIVVAAIEGPETDERGYPKQARRPSLLDGVLNFFAPPTAEAHGVPWDLWVVNVDGSGLRRLTNFYEDLPMVTFTPDGTEMIVMAYGGFYRMNADGSRLRRIAPQGDHGGVDWAGAK